MVAIATQWGLDMEKSDQMPQAESCQDVGRVIRDPDTGKIYVIKEAEEDR